MSTVNSAQELGLSTFCSDHKSLGILREIVHLVLSASGLFEDDEHVEWPDQNQCGPVCIQQMPAITKHCAGECVVS